MEAWHTLEEYPTYLISSNGRIASMNKGLKLRNIQLDLNGYQTVRLKHKDNTHKHEFVHRLVALAHIPNPRKLPIVNHKDWNTGNNTVANLEWCSHAYNSSYRQPTKPAITQLVSPTVQDSMEWRSIQEFPNYEVSSSGLVRNAYTKELLALQLNNGYLCVKLRHDNERKQRSVHRLVIESFLNTKIDEAMVVNHIDGNKQNNALGNLEIVTQSENVLHALSVSKTRKTTCVIQYDSNNVEVARYDSIRSAASAVGVSAANISNVLNGSQKTCLGFKWVRESDAKDKPDKVLVPDDIAPRKVLQLDSRGAIIAKYHTVASAARVTGVQRQNIRKVINGQRNNAGGYIWKIDT